MEPPPVVLVHGLATPARRTWTEAGWVELLAELGHQVTTVDLPGHGDRAPLPSPGDYGSLPAWLLDQLPAQVVDGVGFSLGARLLLLAAAAEPGRFRRLVLAGIGAQALSPDPARAARILSAVRGEPEPDDPGAAYFDRLADHDDVDRRAVADLLGHLPPLTTDLCARVSVPVLVVLGDADDSGPVEPLLEALPNARGRSLRGVDHFMTPKALGFLDAAIDFLGTP